MLRNLLDSIKLLKSILPKSEHLVFLTGAGISKESGIPTFRGYGGLWKTYDPMKLASVSAFIEDSSLVWEFYAYRQKVISECHPNVAHMAISNIQQQKKDSWVLTQNVDNLHERAGSKNIVKLHGDIFKVYCIHCGYYGNMDRDVPPLCPNCNNVLKPGVVLFEETLPKKEWAKAIELSSSCDLMLVIGTSLNVSPANTLPLYAKDNNATLVEINTEATELSKLMDFSLQGTASQIMPKIKGLLEN
jgi:NAD-dependent deacetylase